MSSWTASAGKGHAEEASTHRRRMTAALTFGRPRFVRTFTSSVESRTGLPKDTVSCDFARLCSPIRWPCADDSATRHAKPASAPLLQLAVLALRAVLDVGRSGRPRLPSLLPRGRPLEPAVQPGRPRAARGPRPPLQGPRGPKECGETIRPGARGRCHVDGVRPWTALFDLKFSRKPEDTDIVPFWVYPLEGGAHIERHVPALPMSRDEFRAEQLRRSLTVYRMAFGHSRQEDVVKYLLGKFEAGDVEAMSRELCIDLAPDRRVGRRATVTGRLCAGRGHRVV